MTTQVEAFTFGSVPLKTYLPDGDIDLSVFCSPEVAQALRDTWALKLQAVLESEQRKRSAPYKIRDVQVINAEVSASETCLCMQLQFPHLTASCFAGQAAQMPGAQHHG